MLLEGSPYENQQQLQGDIDYFLKKMGWDEDRLKVYLVNNEILHSNYVSEKKSYNLLKSVRRLVISVLNKSKKSVLEKGAS